VKRLPYTDAFVDESIRGQRYLMACVLLEAAQLAVVRNDLRALVLHGGRVHFHNESASRRRLILEAIAGSQVSSFVVVCHRGHGVSEFQARDMCLARIVDELQQREVGRLTIESRQDDRDDTRTLRRARRPHPSLVWEHALPTAEPLLWVADGLAWAVGAGGRWRDSVTSVVADVIDLRP
jgi:hypothetical protein